MLPFDFKIREKEELKAIYKQDPSDLEEALKNLEIYDIVREGDLKCRICTEPVKLDNLGAISGKEDNITLVCDKMLCLEEASFELGESDEF